MKKVLLGLTILISLNALALEGCEVIARSGNSAERNGATTSRNYPLEKCAKELVRTVVEGNWEQGVAEHLAKDGTFTHLKIERTSREEFIRVRNNH